MIKKTKYFFDAEFIENGSTIDLISLGIVCEDGRTLYVQNQECKFQLASDWVWQNVFPKLTHFDMAGKRSCQQYKALSHDPLTGKCAKTIECPWRYRSEIRDEVLAFCLPEVYGKPEFWAYYGAYDWVSFCQLFGTMMELPKGFPMFCNDVKQLCDSIGNPQLTKQDPASEHHALNDAKWTRNTWLYLNEVKESALEYQRQAQQIQK